MADGRCKTLAFKLRNRLKKLGVSIPVEKFPVCCESCHDDFDNGRDDLCEIKDNGTVYDVCCEVKMWYLIQIGAEV